MRRRTPHTESEQVWRSIAPVGNTSKVTTTLGRRNRVMDSDTMLAQREAAKFLGVSPATLNSWRCQRIGPSWIRISSRCVRYRVGDLRQWLEGRRVETADSRRLEAAS